MKKQTILLLVMLLGLAMPILAQNKKVEDRIQLAREKYTEGLALVTENEEKGVPGYTKIVREQMWAAIGPRVDTMRFYYYELRKDEREPYPDGYALRFARRQYNVSVCRHLEEYLYDDKGKPLFYFSRFEEFLNEEDCGFHLYGNPESGLPEFEVRLYYDEKGKVIRSIYKMLDENGKMKEMTASQAEILKKCSYETAFTYMKNVFDAIYQ